MSIKHEANLRTDVAVSFPLFQSRGQGQEEKEEPRDSDFEEHLKVQVLTDSRVQWGPHEAIVNGITGHSMVVTGDINGVEVQQPRAGDSIENGKRHEFTEIIDDVAQMEHIGEVQYETDGDGGVEREHGITEVRQLTVFQVSERLTFGPNSWQGQVENALEKHV